MKFEIEIPDDNITTELTIQSILRDELGLYDNEIKVTKLLIKEK